MEEKLEAIIRQEILNGMNKEFDEYKQKCLEELDRKFEYKRNKILSDALNRLSIEVSRNEFGMEPIINVRIETKPIIRKEDI